MRGSRLALLSALLDFAKYHFGGVVPWYTGYATARVRRCTALEKPLNGRFVIGIMGNRSAEENLIQAQFAVMNVTVGKVKHALQIRRYQYLFVKY